MRKHYILNGFYSKASAQKRNHEFALKQGVKERSVTKNMFRLHCLTREEWGLEVTEEHIILLDDHEKTIARLKEIPFQPFIQPSIPMVYRFLEKEWVDLSFSEGKIRLSSFYRFRKHADEQRGDKGEVHKALGT